MTRMTDQLLRRRRDQAKLGGVCAGLGARFGVDPTWIRVGAILFAVITTKVAIASYLIAWLLMEED